MNRFASPKAANPVPTAGLIDAQSLRAAETVGRPSGGAKAAKRHQVVSGYWHSLATLARWCRIRDALAGKPWLPPLPAIA